MPYPPGINTWDLPGCSRDDERWDHFSEAVWEEVSYYFVDPERHESFINDEINESDTDEDPSVVAERIYEKIVENYL